MNEHYKKVSIGFLAVFLFLSYIITPASARLITMPDGTLIIDGEDLEDPNYQCIIPPPNNGDFREPIKSYISPISQNECTTMGGQWIPINGIPEFPTVALPVIAVICLMFLFQRRKGK